MIGRFCCRDGRFGSGWRGDGFGLVRRRGRGCRGRFAAVAMAVMVLLGSTAVWLGSAEPSWALDDDEFGGYKAEKLDIEVGYFGGPYYQKASFTVEQLWAMDVVYDDYTFIDNMPSVIIDHVAGVRLSDLMEAAGIDLNSVQNFYFWTNDKTSDYYTSFAKTELIDTPRYCYYSLPENFDAATGTGNASAADMAQRVDTVIALGDDWNRCIAGGEFGSDYLNLNTNTRFRLIYGMTDTQSRTAGRSAKWIHKIVVDLGGSPTVSVTDSELSGKVGSVLRTTASVRAADSAISDAAQITWSSSDESVAAVDESGNITVKSEGTAVITATFGGASASVTINGSGDEAESKPVDASGDGGGSGSAGAGSVSGADAKSPAVIAEEGIGNSGSKVMNLVPTDVVSNEDIGGVQNWRVYEMSQDAQALPQIKEDNPMLPVMGGGACVLFAAGVIGRIFKYRLDLGNGGKK